MRQETLNIRISVYWASDDVNKLTAPRTIYGKFFAIVGPPRLTMAAMDGPPGLSTAP